MMRFNSFKAETIYLGLLAFLREFYKYIYENKLGWTTSGGEVTLRLILP